MINKVILIGNLGDAPVSNEVNGQRVAKFRLATNESYKDKLGEWKTETQWHDVVMWRQLAERAVNLKKGSLVYVEGKLTHRKYTNKNNVEVYLTEVVAGTFRMLDKKETATQSATTVDDPIGGTNDPDDLGF